MGAIIGLALLAAFLVWLVMPTASRKYHAADDPVEPVDAATLEAAEREVRDLGAAQDPEQGFEGDDWGPGTAGPNAK